MANSTGDNVPKAGLEMGGELSPEEAERFASSFRPSWELDDAPFAAGSGLTQDDLLTLAGDANTVVDLQEPFKQAPSAAHPLPSLGSTQPLPKTPSKPPPPKPVAKAVPATSPTGYDGVAPLYIKPSRPKASSATALSTSDIELPKKSNKAVVIGVVAVLALAGIGVGLKFALSGDDKPKDTTSTQTQPTSPARDDSTRSVPPPTPPADTATAAATTTTTTPAATTAAKATAAPKDTATVAAAPKDPPHPPVTPAPTTPPKPTAVAQTQPRPQPPAPAPQPKPPNKPSGGGIVRDNPF